MTQEQATKMWPIIKAFSEGKTIQWCGTTIEQEWKDDNGFDPKYCDNTIHYRIKPEPKLRPWKPEEVPVGAIVRGIDFKARRNPVIILSVNPEESFFWFFAEGGRMQKYSLHGASFDLQHSLDNGKTWQPCGVEE